MLQNQILQKRLQNEQIRVEIAKQRFSPTGPLSPVIMSGPVVFNSPPRIRSPPPTSPKPEIIKPTPIKAQAQNGQFFNQVNGHSPSTSKVRGDIVKVGRIQWPPPKEEEKKHTIRVGRLTIDETQEETRQANVKRNISGRGTDMKEKSAILAAKFAQKSPVDPQPPLRKIEPQAQPQIVPVPIQPQPTQPPPPAPPIEEVKKTNPIPIKEKLVIHESSPQTTPVRVIERVLERKETLEAVRAPSTVSPTPSELSEPEEATDLKRQESLKTRLFPLPNTPFLTYVSVPWNLYVRKEVFSPVEKLDDPTLEDMIFSQIVRDVYSNSCIRIEKDVKLRMKSKLEGHGVTLRSINGKHKPQLKRYVIDQAREWPFYFCRMFAVKPSRINPDVQLVGVGSNGMVLLTRERDIFEDQLRIIDRFEFDQIIDVSVPKPFTVQIHVKNQHIIVYTKRAKKLANMIDAFCIESEGDSIWVKAVKNYYTRESTLLSFEKGDLIKLTNRDMQLDKGWLYGSCHGKAGLFPSDHVKSVAGYQLKRAMSPTTNSDSIFEDNILLKHSMMQFANLYFRKESYRSVVK